MFGAGFVSHTAKDPSRLLGTVDHAKEGFDCRYIADTHGVAGFSGTGLYTMGSIVAVHQGGASSNHNFQNAVFSASGNEDSGVVKKS